jgi:hypothetical protein
MRALDELAEMKGQTGPEAARHAAALLDRLSRARFRDPADLIRLHETVLFLRAYPQDECVARAADALLFPFAGRLRGIDLAPFDDPEVSGIAGTPIATVFSAEFARHLASAHGGAVSIDWEDYEHSERLAPLVARAVPMAYEEYAVEPHMNVRSWFEKGRLDLRWALASAGESYDLLEIPLRWELGDSDSSRTRLRLEGSPIFYQTGPFLKRKDVSIEAGFAEPPLRVRKVPRARARAVLGKIMDASATRYRELHGFQHADADHMYRAEFGRGVEMFYFGVIPARRLPLRAYHAGMFFRSGVPVGYVETLSLFERTEIGFNLFYTFRDGETAFLYARMLKLLREQFGLTRVWVDPYQIGHENEEAIASGAFWFYRKLGFQPVRPEAQRLVAKEEDHIAANPAYRTPAATLRRLAASPMTYGGGDASDWAGFSMQNFGGKIPDLGEDLQRAKLASEEIGYLRLLQSRPALRRKILRLGSP